MDPYYNDDSVTIYHGDSREALAAIPAKSVGLVWTDPPFNTGKAQTLVSTGATYDDKYTSTGGYLDEMRAVFTAVRPLLAPTAVVCVCLDWRSVHDVKVNVLDGIFGADRFMGEVIWHSELGAGSKRWWSNKHNTILTYAAGPNPTFNLAAVPTTTRNAPKDGYVGDRRVNSVWNLTLSSTDPERVGYPNQKPVRVITPFVEVHTSHGATVLDPFMGSGSTLDAARRCGRVGIGVDRNEAACRVAAGRLMSATLPFLPAT